MNILTNFIFKKSSFSIGFFISLLGTLPFGYLNIIGLQLLLEKGNWATSSFIFGVVVVEFFVLKITAFGAKWLVEQKKILLFIDVFTVVFFSSIAFYFYFNIGNEKNFSLTQLQLVQFPFVLGLVLNSLNFMQWPYWSGIYLYLFRTKKLQPNTKQNNIFITGALLGTFVGMLFFAQTGNYFLIDKKMAINKYLNVIFTLIFSVLALFQFINLFWKRRKVNVL